MTLPPFKFDIKLSSLFTLLILTNCSQQLQQSIVSSNSSQQSQQSTIRKGKERYVFHLILSIQVINDFHRFYPQWFFISSQWICFVFPQRKLSWISPSVVLYFIPVDLFRVSFEKFFTNFTLSGSLFILMDLFRVSSKKTFEDFNPQKICYMSHQRVYYIYIYIYIRKWI
jgi:hypothetical protein